MKARIVTVIGALVLWTWAVSVSGAESLSVLLQKGIFAEDTEGNLEAAIKIYEQVAYEASANRSVAAQAQYRLGVCYQKKGNKEQGVSALKDLLKQFPSEAVLGEKARGLLAELGQAPSSEVTIRCALTNAAGLGEVLTADGKYICRIDGKTGEVVQYDIGSGQTRRITNTGGAEAKETPYEYQAISRDGKQIAYDSFTKDSVAQLRVRKLDGSGLRTLYSEKGYHARPLDWSPDASSILASREQDSSAGGGRELTLISTADGSVRVLKRVDSNWPGRARFSPDGHFIAFSLVAGNPPNGDLFLMTADGRDEVGVARHPAEDQLLGWVADGSSILFFSDRAGTRDIRAVPVAGGKQQGEPTVLKKDLGQDAQVLGLAPDGRAILALGFPSRLKAHCGHEPGFSPRSTQRGAAATERRRRRDCWCCMVAPLPRRAV